ncbi:MAG: TerB family tellurite resistance protein, partial [Methyloceanibacter sp.]
EMAMADGVVHEFESNLVWRAAELLGVSTRDRVLLRKAVASRVGCDLDT